MTQQRTSWPAIKTTPLEVANRQMMHHGTGTPMVGGAVAVVLIVPMIGLLLGLAAMALHEITFARPLTEVVGGAAFIMVYSVVLTAPMMVVALPLAHVALRHGVAGWATAALAGGGATAVLGMVLTQAQEVMAVLMFSAIGIVFGLVFWLGARLIGKGSVAWQVPPHDPEGVFTSR